MKHFLLFLSMLAATACSKDLPCYDPSREWGLCWMSSNGAPNRPHSVMQCTPDRIVGEYNIDYSVNLADRWEADKAKRAQLDREDIANIQGYSDGMTAGIKMGREFAFREVRQRFAYREKHLPTETIDECIDCAEALSGYSGVPYSLAYDACYPNRRKEMEEWADKLVKEIIAKKAKRLIIESPPGTGAFAPTTNAMIRGTKGGE